MPAAVRLNDMCTGHGCFSARANAQGSPDTFINDRPAHRKTDVWLTHCCVVCHGASLAQGSPDSFVNDLEQARVGDPTTCGSTCATGSPDTFVN